MASNRDSVTLDSVMNALRTVKDPETQRDFMSLGRIRDLKTENNSVAFKLILTKTTWSTRAQIENQLREALQTHTGADHISIALEIQGGAGGRAASPDKLGIPGVKHIIAVSSGKGGVGKSTVAVNLACALAKSGRSVGLLDSDVYGPNIPTMMGVQGVPHARRDEKRGELISPLQAHGVKVMSMGFLTKGDQPLVWRGPMLHGVVSQFLMNVDWGNLDYLVVDMPPGTGDVQLSLTQLVSVTGAVVVTTPQEVSLQDVRKAILMFEKVGVPVLGVVENMSYFVCDKCDEQHQIFGTGGGQSLAEKFETRLLAKLPLASSVRSGGDQGIPIVVGEPDSIQSQAFMGLALAVEQEVRVSAEEAGTESGSPTVEIGQF